LTFFPASPSGHDLFAFALKAALLTSERLDLCHDWRCSISVAEHRQGLRQVADLTIDLAEPSLNRGDITLSRVTRT
jgi:hypothetical protein